jgi:hypothetical protein
MRNRAIANAASRSQSMRAFCNLELARDLQLL